MATVAEEIAALRGTRPASLRDLLTDASFSRLWTPAKDASLPNLVARRQLPNANSVGLISTYGTLPLGAAIYTALAGIATAVGSRVAYFHSRTEFLALWLDALTFLFSARMVWGLQVGRTASEKLRLAGKAK